MKMFIVFVLLTQSVFETILSFPMKQGCILCQDFNRKNKEQCASTYEECGECLDGFIVDDDDPKICFAIEILENPISTTSELEGSDIELTCLFNSPVLCVWERNGQHVSVGGHSRYQFKEGVNEEKDSYDCTLKINQLSTIDVGQWQCSSRASSYSNSIKSQIAHVLITINEETEPELKMSAMQLNPGEPHIYFQNELVDRNNLNYQSLLINNGENSIITCHTQNVRDLMWKINAQNVIKKFATKSLSLGIREIESFINSSDWENALVECVTENEEEVNEKSYVILINNKEFSKLKAEMESIKLQFRSMNFIYATFLSLLFIILSILVVYFKYYFLIESKPMAKDEEKLIADEESKS